MQFDGSLVRAHNTTYNTKDIQTCQDVEQKNLTEVADDRKTRTLLSETSQLFENCLALTYICLSGYEEECHTPESRQKKRLGARYEE